MKENIYTIPLIDAFKADDECPFCLIKRQLEQDALDFTLGASYMEDDIRATTDQMGFCPTHYQKIYDYGNRLGTALILHSHYQKLEKEFATHIASFSPSKSTLFSKYLKGKNSSESQLAPITQWALNQQHSCYICDRIEKDFNRYLHTFFYLLESQPDFIDLFKGSKGFCLPHFGDLMALAETQLSTATKATFYPLLFEKMQHHLLRLEKDLEWFIEKYDYKNREADWKTSKDAIPRSIQKLSSIYPEDEIYKEK